MPIIPPNMDPKADLILEVVASIVKDFHQTQDFEQGCKIISERHGDTLGFIFEGAKASDMSKMLTGLMRGTWNYMPLASQHYRTSPLPELRRNDKCWCGSQLKYKQCCLKNKDLVAPIDSDLIWSLLISELSSEEMELVIKQRAIPASLLVGMAAEDIENGQNHAALKKLEPLFLQKLDKANEEVCFAVTMLCNVYDDLGEQTKKLELLDKIKSSGSKPLRSEAWQRLATIYLDQGNTDDAWDAFHTARHLDPTNTGVDLLEISLLMGEKEFDRAQQRAKFIIKRLQRDGFYEKNESTEFLELIATDPKEGFDKFFGDNSEQTEVIDGLADWLNMVKDRTIPAYKTTELPPFEMDDGSDSPEAPPSIFTFNIPTKIAKLEKQWQNIFHDTDVWDGDGKWIDFIQENPGCFDSFNVLDDITHALDDWEADEYILNNLLIPIGKRALDIYNKFPVSGPFEWVMQENRPLIRTLYAYSRSLRQIGDWDSCIQIVETILEISPNDNIGIRGLLINHYLQQQDHQKAKKILEAYPEDLIIDLQMGKVLYLLQTGQENEAFTHWIEVQSQYPYVKRYMVNTAAVEPEISGYGVAVGSKQEAWFYRQTMRAAWLQQRGSIGWLKKY